MALNTDIRRKPLDFGGLVLFFIECKRADPDIKNWVFSRDPDKCIMSPTFFLKKIIDLKPEIERIGNFPGLDYSGPEDLNYCLQCVEFNESLNSFNRNQEKVVYKPLLQANHALSALFYKNTLDIEELEFSIKDGYKNFKEILFLPIVVTTANLFVADYNPMKVDIKKGVINKTDVKFDGPKKWITYEFPLPDYLKYSSESVSSYVKSFRKGESLFPVERITTFIVNSKHWKEFLQKFTFQKSA